MSPNSYMDAMADYNLQDRMNQNIKQTHPDPSPFDSKSILWPPKPPRLPPLRQVCFDIPCTKPPKVKSIKSLKDMKESLDEEFAQQKRSETKKGQPAQNSFDLLEAKKRQVVDQFINMKPYLPGAPQKLMNYSAALSSFGLQPGQTAVDPTLPIPSSDGRFSEQLGKFNNQDFQIPDEKLASGYQGSNNVIPDRQASILSPNGDVLNQNVPNSSDGTLNQNYGVLAQNAGYFPRDRSMSKENEIPPSRSKAFPCGTNNVWTNPPYDGRCVCICKFPFSPDLTENCDPNCTSGVSSSNADTKSGKYIGILRKSSTKDTGNMCFKKRPLPMNPNIQANKKEMRELASDEKIGFAEYMRNKMIEERERMGKPKKKVKIAEAVETASEVDEQPVEEMQKADEAVDASVDPQNSPIKKKKHRKHKDEKASKKKVKKSEKSSKKRKNLKSEKSHKKNKKDKKEKKREKSQKSKKTLDENKKDKANKQTGLSKAPTATTTSSLTSFSTDPTDSHSAIEPSKTAKSDQSTNTSSGPTKVQKQKKSKAKDDEEVDHSRHHKKQIHVKKPQKKQKKQKESDEEQENSESSYSSKEAETEAVTKDGAKKRDDESDKDKDDSPTVKAKPLKSDHDSQKTGHESPTTGHESPTTGHESPTTGDESPTTKRSTQISAEKSPMDKQPSPTMNKRPSLAMSKQPSLIMNKKPSLAMSKQTSLVMDKRPSLNRTSIIKNKPPLEPNKPSILKKEPEKVINVEYTNNKLPKEAPKPVEEPKNEEEPAPEIRKKMTLVQSLKSFFSRPSLDAKSLMSKNIGPDPVRTTKGELKRQKSTLHDIFRLSEKDLARIRMKQARNSLRQIFDSTQSGDSKSQLSDSIDSEKHTKDVETARKKLEMQLKGGHLKYCFIENKSVDWNEIINGKPEPLSKKDPAVDWLLDFFTNKKLQKDDRYTMNFEELLQFASVLDPEKVGMLKEVLGEANDKTYPTSVTQPTPDTYTVDTSQIINKNHENVEKVNKNVENYDTDVDDEEKEKQKQRKAMYEKFMGKKPQSGFTGFNSSSEASQKATTDEEAQGTETKNKKLKETSATMLSEDHLSSIIDELSDLVSLSQSSTSLKNQNSIAKLEAVENFVEDKTNEDFLIKLLNGYFSDDFEIREDNTSDQEVTIPEEGLWKLTEKMNPHVKKQKNSTKPKFEKKKSIKQIDDRKCPTRRSKGQLRSPGSDASNGSLYDCTIEEEVLKLIEEEEMLRLIEENADILFNEEENIKTPIQEDKKGRNNKRRKHREEDEDREVIHADRMIEEEDRKIREKREQLQQLEQLHKQVVARSDSISILSRSSFKSGASYSTVEDQLEVMIDNLLQDTNDDKKKKNKEEKNNKVNKKEENKGKIKEEIQSVFSDFNTTQNCCKSNKKFIKNKRMKNKQFKLFLKGSKRNKENKQAKRKKPGNRKMKKISKEGQKEEIIKNNCLKNMEKLDNDHYVMSWLMNDHQDEQ